MKQYRRKVLIGMASPGENKPIKKSINSSERLKAKREVKRELENEDMNWREIAIKDFHYYAKRYTDEFMNTLWRLDIPVFEKHDDYGYGWWEEDHQATIVEKLIPAPPGWEWCGETIQKI
jgi:hypothetical protein